MLTDVFVSCYDVCMCVRFDVVRYVLWGVGLYNGKSLNEGVILLGTRLYFKR